ncbi:hypothetical protein HY947_02400 [Candidatus Gottesmanbacteria bacterium]|nr:hypothetical protein [Candidatus Gottesmanbacteria bacterium]
MKKKAHKPVVHHKRKENPPFVLWMPLAALVFFIVAAVTWRVMTTSSEVSSPQNVKGASVSTSDMTKEVDSLTTPDDKAAFESLKKEVKGL